ncbi:MAG: LysR family transcriptional regulator [Inquilinaceae bacterium]
METGLRRLRYFSVLATELNFRRTADKLNITQPALSRAIVQLEDEVGVRLLERSNRQVRLTHAGESFAAGCKRVLDSLVATIDQTQKVARGYAGALTIGYTDTAIAGTLPDLIKSFLGEAPEVHIRLVQVYSERQLVMLRDGSIDIAIMTGPVADDELEAIDMQLDRFVALVPHDNPLASASRVSLGDLAHYPFVLGDPEAWAMYNALLFAHCEKVGIRPRILQTAPESRAIVGLVACGLGVSVMPECVARTVDRRIAVRPIHDVDDRMRTQAVWPKRASKPALARFVKHVSDTAEPQTQSL